MFFHRNSSTSISNIQNIGPRFVPGFRGSGPRFLQGFRWPGPRFLQGFRGSGPIKRLFGPIHMKSVSSQKDSRTEIETSFDHKSAPNFDAHLFHVEKKQEFIWKLLQYMHPTTRHASDTIQASKYNTCIRYNTCFRYNTLGTPQNKKLCCWVSHFPMFPQETRVAGPTYGISYLTPGV